MSAARRLASIALCAACSIAPIAARADGTVWDRARRPDAAVGVELLHQADALIAKREHVRATTHLVGDVSSFTDLYLREAQKLLERAGGEASPNFDVRLRYGNVLSLLHDVPGCVRVFEAFVKAHPPAHLLADGSSELAVCYAHLNRRSDEIRAYDLALSVEVNNVSRARLLANRAETLMATGDLSGAVTGYRTAIASLVTPYDMSFSPTTYWGLGVALDRAGDLDAGMAAIHLARAYDDRDSEISSSDWFYSPDYDESWYKALGHWTRAREAVLPAARTEEYLAAVASWDEYIQRAPADDLYLPTARAHLKACELERVRDAGSRHRVAKTKGNK